MTSSASVPRKRGTGRILLLLSGLFLLAGGAWFLSPGGRQFRLHRMDTASLLRLSSANPGDVVVLEELASRAERQGYPEEAARNYTEAARADRGKARYWNRVAEIALQREDREAALQATQEAVRAEPGSAEAHRLLGEVLSRDNAWSQAYDAYKFAADHDSNRASAWAGLAQAAFETRRWQEAMNASAKAATLEPQQFTHSLLRGRTALASGDLESARQALQEAKRLAPDNPDVLLEWGSLHARLTPSPENAAEAARSFQRATEILAKKREAFAPLYRWGQWLLEQGRAEEAVTRLREALVIKPADTDASYALSRALLLSGKREEADRLIVQVQKRQATDLQIAQLQKRIGREPERADLFARLGDAYAEQGNREQALTFWNRSLQLSPRQPALQARRDKALQGKR